MPDEPNEVRSPETFLLGSSSSLRDILRYGLSMAIVAACGGGLIVAIGRTPPDQDAAAETDYAVMIDLPPLEASSQLANDAAEGPEQQAAAATNARQTSEPVEPPQPIEESKPREPAPAAEEPPLPAQPYPSAVLEREQQQPVSPPKPVVVPATSAQDDRAPAGSQTPSRTDANAGDEGQPAPSAHAITLWQRSLMKRLETAKREVGSQPHAFGTVKVAFEIDVTGKLASERIAHSSGSASLDRAALLLVRQAAPFPAPPRHAASRNTSFVVPVRFR